MPDIIVPQQMPIILPENIFNTQKTDYGRGESLFFGQAAGLFDTVNRKFPKIWEHYKNQKQLGKWDEQEFDFRPMAMEFTSRPKSMSNRMINTLAWQWEADSIAARTLLPVMAPFISAPELQAAYGEVTTNEVVHAATYSEIVRYSFEDPNAVLADVLANQHAMHRMKTASRALSRVYELSHQYALGQIGYSQLLYNAVYLMLVAMLCLERIQFIASFAITFAIGEIGAFMQICTAVQKICQDEYEVHVALGRDVLDNEHQTEAGRIALKETEKVVRQMIREFIASEFAWIDYMDLDNDQLPGLNGRMCKEWVLLGAGDVYDACKLLPDEDLVIPTKNPLGYMSHWMDISDRQISPQEQRGGQYKMGILTRHGEQDQYTVDF
jgi:ribonucleoside-diphosphate reductase beta chain